jgi:hypothetical protein
MWELHGVLQLTMGWEGIHLFQFDIRAVQYGSFELLGSLQAQCRMTPQGLLVPIQTTRLPYFD